MPLHPKRISNGLNTYDYLNPGIRWVYYWGCHQVIVVILLKKVSVSSHSLGADTPGMLVIAPIPDTMSKQLSWLEQGLPPT